MRFARLQVGITPPVTVDSRPRAHDIYARVAESGRAELARPVSGLAFSGLFAGIAMGLSALGSAAALDVLGTGGAGRFAAALLYPLGFMAVILGRAQLFTENTLYPVVIVLEEHGRHLGATARLWAVVFTANIVGAILFSLLAVKSGALSASYEHQLVQLGHKTLQGPFGTNFFSAVIAGFVIALVAWLVEAADAAVGRLFVIGAFTALIALGSFDHAIASACETISSTIAGDTSVGGLAVWLTAVTLGNVVGGVVIVSLLNYGQVRAGNA
jgi:formate/nitrite transporter FocA (FNT family)